MTTDSAPWLNEPDEYDFTDEATGLPIALRRHPTLKIWRGYVGIPDNHPWYGRSHDHIGVFVSCHGGLTYSGTAHWGDLRASYWFGFDCAHAGDLVPGIGLTPDLIRVTGFSIPDRIRMGEVYRDLEYVKAAAIGAAADIGARMPEHEAEE
jgi:hypothetical protein